MYDSASNNRADRTPPESHTREGRVSSLGSELRRIYIPFALWIEDRHVGNGSFPERPTGKSENSRRRARHFVDKRTEVNMSFLNEIRH